MENLIFILIDLLINFTPSETVDTSYQYDVFYTNHPIEVVKDFPEINQIQLNDFIFFNADLANYRTSKGLTKSDTIDYGSHRAAFNEKVQKEINQLTIKKGENLVDLDQQWDAQKAEFNIKDEDFLALCNTCENKGFATLFPVIYLTKIKDAEQKTFYYDVFIEVFLAHEGKIVFKKKLESSIVIQSPDFNFYIADYHWDILANELFADLNYHLNSVPALKSQNSE
ncbi:MAG: hypothetical protein ACQESK_00910 [Bacteroidota bacterium]